MEIKNSIHQDIDEIFRLYKIATEFQKTKFISHWPEFEKEMVLAEIEQNRQFKLVVNGQIACVWAVTFDDPEIWDGLNNDAAVYIHRIATNPEFRGQNLVQKIVDWAWAYAVQHHKDYIRMDTVGDNRSLIEYYQKSGFDFLGLSKLEKTENLPAHYKNATVSLFQIKL